MHIGPTKGRFTALISPRVGDQCVDARPGRGALRTHRRSSPAKAPRPPRSAARHRDHPEAHTRSRAATRS